MGQDGRRLRGVPIGDGDGYGVIKDLSAADTVQSTRAHSELLVAPAKVPTAPGVARALSLRVRLATELSRKA